MASPANRSDSDCTYGLLPLPVLQMLRLIDPSWVLFTVSDITYVLLSCFVDFCRYRSGSVISRPAGRNPGAMLVHKRENSECPPCCPCPPVCFLFFCLFVCFFSGEHFQVISNLPELQPRTLIEFMLHSLSICAIFEFLLDECKSPFATVRFSKMEIALGSQGLIRQSR